MPRSTLRRLLLALAVPAALASVVGARPARADTYPSQPIRLIVPSAAGGGYDVVGRLLAERLGQELGQAIVVENRTGAGTLVGTQAAATATPDGYTLLVGGLANIAFNQGLYDKLPYKPSDLTPIALAGSFSYTLVARPDLPQTNLREVIEFARSHPGKLNIATAGVGTGQQVAAALLKSVAGIDLTEVPYKGAQPAYTDLFGGRVDLFFDNTSTARPFVDAKRAKALVNSGASRDPLLPQVPTGAEAGATGLVLESWIGLFAPTRTPAPVLERLRTAMTKVMQSPDVRKRFETQGIRPSTMTPAETPRFIEAEVQKWPPFLRKAGIRAE